MEIKRPFGMSQSELAAIGKQASDEAIAALQAQGISIFHQGERGFESVDPDGTVRPASNSTSAQ